MAEKATVAKKRSVCSKVYIGPDGAETRSATPTATELQFRFANGNVHSVKAVDHNKEIAACLLWFGISEKYGNAYAGAKGNADTAEDAFLSMQEQLRGGTWVERAEGVGPRPSMVADAIKRALEASGEKVDEARFGNIRDQVKDKDVRKNALNDPVINAQFESIKAEKAAERAKKAMDVAKGSKLDVSNF